MELESKVKELEEEMRSGPSTKTGESKIDSLPRSPPQLTLQGHRSPITVK